LLTARVSQVLWIMCRRRPGREDGPGNDRVDAVERPVLPGCELVDDLVGDLGDQLARHLGAIDLGQVRGDLPGGQTLGVEADDGLVEALHPAGMLGHDPRLEVAVAVPRNGGTGPTSVRTLFGELPLR
jgi:hypothetical protein